MRKTIDLDAEGELPPHDVRASMPSWFPALQELLKLAKECKGSVAGKSEPSYG